MSIWLLAVLGGVVVLGRYSLAAGPAAVAQKRWPTDLNLPRIAGRDTLVMVVHPECPCSRASMRELAEIQANCGDHLSIQILFAQPRGLARDVQSTDLWQSASQIPGARSIVDNDGTLAHGFGAKTSGQVFLFDRTGILQFSGGITDARGHEGDNAGQLAIEDIAHERKPQVVRTPVFGCSL
jgi:hypothetical protein